MLKIRLRRTGARKRPNYRVVVTEHTAPRDGKYIEIIGFYDPLTEPATVRIDGDKAQRWIGHGAQPTERVARLLAREGIIEARPVPPPARSAEPAPSTAPAAATAAVAAPLPDTEEAAPVTQETDATEGGAVGAGEAGATTDAEPASA